MPVEITLGADPASGQGGVTVPVYPQRHAYITNRLGAFVNELAETGDAITEGGLLSTAGAQTYKLLSALVPNLSKRMAEWEFRGLAGRDAEEYDPALDTTSPSIPEIREALRVAAEVNGLDILTHLKGVFGLVDPTVLKVVRGIVSEQVLNAIESISTTLPSSPSATGESASTSFGTTPPTSTGNGVSRSPVSVA